MSFSKFVGKTDEELLPPDTARLFAENDRQVLAQGVSVQTTEVLPQADGIEHLFFVNKFLVSGLDGETSHVAGVELDITEIKRAEKEIENLNSEPLERTVELEEANRELEAFNHTVAHDLRQPLNAISSYCQAIEMVYGDQFRDDCLGYVKGVYKATLRMNGLIGALPRSWRILRGILI